MTNNNLVDTLRGIDFLEGFDENHLELLATVAEPVDFESAKVIFREGDSTDHVYLIVSGSVSLEICAPAVGCRRILTIDEGNLLGWSAVLGQSRVTTTARTLSAIKALRINTSQILTLCEHDPRFGYQFMRQVGLGLAKRLKAARLQLLNVFGAESNVAASSKPQIVEGGNA